MAFIIKDRVKEGTTSTGTGAITLGGAAATFDPFNSYMTNGDTTYYAIVHTSSGVDEWEVGLGTWNTGNTLTRTTVLAGSNGTSAEDFSAGTKDVFMTYPAAHAALAGDDVNFANITVTGTVDGRDVAADGTKLDTVETNADVTDAVNVAAAGALMKSGGTMTGNLILNADPTTALGAATKEYVDTIAAAGIHYHTPVRVETPSALTATYDNGTSGVGATLTNSGTQAALVIDGVTVATNDRVLVYNQTNAAHNGIYTVTNTGSASTNWVLTRATDADSYGASDPNAMGEGDAYFVKEGDTGAGELYVMNTSGTITFGTTEITFTVIAETAVYSAGTGMSLTGTTFSIGQDVGTTANVTFNQVTAAIIGNVTGNLTGDVTGNAGTATALETARTIQLTGDVVGSASFDGTANATITAVVQDDSHSHVISNVDGLQAALDGKTDTTRTITAGNGLTGGGDLSANRTLNVGAGTGVTVGADSISIGQDVGTTANVTFNQVTADNLRIGDWTGNDEYAAVSHSSQTGTEYMMISNDGHTLLSASTDRDVIIRGGNNTASYQIAVYPDAYATSAGSTIITEAGSGLSKSSRTLSHADTSSQASVNNSNGTVIQDITLDGYGHITALGSVNLDDRYVNVTGDTMSGTLVVGQIDSGNPSAGADSIRVSGYGIIGNRGTFYITNPNTVQIGVGSTHNADPAMSFTSTQNTSHHTLYEGSNRVFTDGYHPNADGWTTSRTITLSGDASGSVTMDGTSDVTLSVTVANDSHSHSYYITNNADDTGTGGYRTTGTYWEIGHNSGSVAMTTNDGYGNANLTFNHRNGVPDTTGSACRIETSVDSTTGSFIFEVGNSVTAGTAVSLTEVLKLNTSGATILGNVAWHAGNDGSGSGLDADKLDGYQLSTTRNSANTVPVRDSNGYLQLGWINTTSGSTTSTIDKIYASYDNYIRYITPGTLISQLGLVTSTNITNSTDSLIGKARSLGWYPAYGQSEEGTVFWDDAEEAVALYSSSDTSIGMAFKAVYAKKGQQIRFTVPIKSSAAASDSLYLRIYAHGGDLPDGKFAVSNSATQPNIQEDDYYDHGWYESGAHTTSWRNFERTYVMPADGYVSVVILSWTNFSGTVYAKQPDIQMVSDFTYEDSNRNIRFETNSTDSSGGITLQSSDGDFQFQLYGTTGSYGFLDSNWGGWDIRKYTDGALYLNGSSNYYLQPEATSKLYNLEIDEKIRWVGSIATDDDRGIYFHDSDNQYAIFRESGAWSDPYPDLIIGFHTGIKIGGYTGYGGTRFYSDAPKKSGATEIMSVGDGDTNVRIKNHLKIGEEKVIPDVVWGASSASTGAVLITLPGTGGNYDMFVIELTVYEYNSNAHSKIYISGHNYTTGWYNTRVTVEGGYSKPIYLHRNADDYFIQLGNTNSGWVYGQVHVSKVETATYYNVQNWMSGWSISQVTTIPTMTHSTGDLNTTAAITSKTTGISESYSLSVANQIYHTNDTNTYLQFHNNDQFRVVIAGAEVMEWGNSYAKLGDSDSLYLGAGSDFRMWHDGSHTYFRNYNHANGNIYFQGENTSGVNHGLLYMHTNTSRTYVRLFENSGERLRTMSYGISVTGELRATSNITAYYSDERLKTKVGAIENPLDKVKSLEGFYYVENDVAKEHGFDNEEQQVALSAQAVQEVMPEAVDLAPFDTATDEEGNVYSKSGEEYLTVDYARLVPLLVESIKELEKRVAELEAKQ